MNASQRDRILPYWDVIKLYKDSGQWIGGSEALKVMNQVNIELGNTPTTFNCGSCIGELLRLTYNNYVRNT